MNNVRLSSQHFYHATHSNFRCHKDGIDKFRILPLEKHIIRASG